MFTTLAISGLSPELLAMPAEPAKTRINLDALAWSKPWLRLLHYKHSFPFGTPRSRANAGAFFLSPTGRHDPKSELLATIEAYRNRRLVGQTPAPLHCAFPARYRFLKQALDWTENTEPCPELGAFLEKLGGESISLVFSSAYPSSPPSMFGHTLVRIHSKNRSELLDYAVNYAAFAGPDENAIAFAVLGLTGGYLGQFSVMPYYLKVNEYNHAESRDLWEYELSLSPEEVRVFIEHLWEVARNASFNYYFFDDNCSYLMLKLIEVARPDWELSSFGAHVIPGETIKRLVDTPHAVKQVRYRPSLYRVMRRRFAALTSSGQERARQITTNDTSFDHDSPEVLDTAIALHQHQLLKRGRTIPDQKRYTALLVERSRRGKAAEDLALTSNQGLKGPEWGHGPYLLGIGGGVFANDSKYVGFTELQAKFAYHDLLNSDVGYIPFTQVDFPYVTLRWSATARSFWIERLNVATITSLPSFDTLSHQVSWKFDLAYVSPKDLICEGCHAAMMTVTGGLSKRLFSEHLLLSAIAGAEVEGSGAFGAFWRFLPKAQAIALASPSSVYKIGGFVSAVAEPLQNARQKHFYDLELFQSFRLSQNWETRISARSIVPGDFSLGNPYREAWLRLNVYF